VNRDPIDQAIDHDLAVLDRCNEMNVRAQALMDEARALLSKSADLRQQVEARMKARKRARQAAHSAKSEES
jgi:hypothetical protein